jgi:hypothetical protein
MPGERTFYVQARTGSLITSIVAEKAQVALLAERLGELLEDLGGRLGPGGEDRLRGLRAPLERRDDQRVERDRAEPGAEAARLPAADPVEADAGGPPGQDPAGVRRGPAVPDQQNHGHDAPA